MSVHSLINTVWHAISVRGNSWDKSDELCNYLVRTVRSDWTNKEDDLCGCLMGAVRAFVLLVVLECMWMRQPPSVDQHDLCL